MNKYCRVYLLRKNYHSRIEVLKICATFSFSGERKIEGTRENIKHKNWAPDVFLRSPPPPPRLSKEQKLARGVIVVNKAKQRKIRKASSSSSSKSTLDDSGQSKFNFKKYIFFCFLCKKFDELKGVFFKSSGKYIIAPNFCSMS